MLTGSASKPCLLSKRQWQPSHSYSYVGTDTSPITILLSHSHCGKLPPQRRSTSSFVGEVPQAAVRWVPPHKKPVRGLAHRRLRFTLPPTRVLSKCSCPTLRRLGSGITRLPPEPRRRSLVGRTNEPVAHCRRHPRRVVSQRRYRSAIPRAFRVGKGFLCLWQRTPAGSRFTPPGHAGAWCCQRYRPRPGRSLDSEAGHPGKVPSAILDALCQGPEQEGKSNERRTQVKTPTHS